MAAAKKAEDGGGQIATMLNTLLLRLEPMQAGFVGQAGGTFQKVKADINADLVIIIDALNEVASGIRSAGQDFDVADSDAQAEVSKAAQDAGSIVGRLRGA
jgi:ESAT-6 family protein